MTSDTINAPHGAATALPGSLGAAVAGLGERARVHDLYDAYGARIYDDSTHLEAGEIRAMRRVLRQHEGPVLELAAGSGRLTVPLLTMGRRVTALELETSMIDVLHEHVGALPESAQHLLTVHQGDMTDFDLDASFAVVVLGAASISILDAAGRGRLFRAVRRHLSPGGVMLFSIVVPLGDPSGDLDVVMDVTGRSGRRYRVHEYRADGAVERLVGVYPLSGDGESDDDVVPVCVGTHRVLAFETVLAEIEEAGLVVREQQRFEYAQALAEIFLEVGEPA
jgi:methylation protein MtfA